jgi:hypothetical protein
MPYCSNCGQEKRGAERFCFSCGAASVTHPPEAKLTPTASPTLTPTVAAEAKRGGRLGVIGLFIALGLNLILSISSGGSAIGRAAGTVVAFGIGGAYIIANFLTWNTQRRVVRGAAIGWTIAVFLLLGCLGGLIGIVSPDQPRAAAVLSSSATPPSAQAPAPLPKPLTPAQKRAEAVAAAKAMARAEKDQESVRIGYAKFMENNLLRNNMNVDVHANGPKHTRLTLKWVLVNKSLAFQFTEKQQDLLRQMKNEGFMRFTITDGYDGTWIWDLSK